MEILRRALVFILWIFGSSVCFLLFGISLYALLMIFGIYRYEGDAPYPHMLGFFIAGVINFGLTFLLHYAINWVFQKDYPNLKLWFRSNKRIKIIICGFLVIGLFALTWIFSGAAYSRWGN
tara:strand:- start:137 stop:499 length:363 start_codon:yes stop_codon:yes gene_type:complete